MFTQYFKVDKWLLYHTPHHNLNTFHLGPFTIPWSKLLFWNEVQPEITKDKR